MANNKSNHYYGYVLRNPGTPAQHWVFSQLPINCYHYPTKVITSTTTSPVPVGGTQFITNLCESEIGLYKFEVTMIVQSEAAGRFEVDLVKDQQIIGKGIFSTVADATGKFTGEVKITAVSKVCPCDSVVSLVNNSAAEYTPMLVNNSSLLMIIDKLY